jgi:hypothetical protein
MTLVWTQSTGWLQDGVPVTNSPEPQRPPTLVKRFVVEEHEGYTGKVVGRDYFLSMDDALLYQTKRKNMNKVAGIGGKWTHYWSYPREVEVPSDLRIRAEYEECGSICPTGQHTCNDGVRVEKPHKTHFFYCDCTEIGEGS